VCAGRQIDSLQEVTQRPHATSALSEVHYGVREKLRRLVRRFTGHACDCPMPDSTTEKESTEHDLDERFELLQFSYREVLDATKHQDDKINRLLTTVAFLTAASLALAGLLSGKSITAVYIIDRHLRLPLGLIALAGFLSGITVTVIMLISSLTTPLVFPGGSKAILPEIPYVNNIKFGQVYFYEIAKTAPPEWYAKWADDTTVVDLKRERNASLVRETHNLAVRTDFKYQRSNEAVAVLSFAMLSFILAALLILIASQRPTTMPVNLNWTVKSILATIFFLYCWLQLISTQRGTPPTVFDRAYPTMPGRWSKCCRIAYPLLMAAEASEVFLMGSLPYRARVLLACGLPLVAWTAFRKALPWHSEVAQTARDEVVKKILGSNVVNLPSPPTEHQLQARKQALRRTARLAAILATAYASIGLWAALSSAHREAIGLSSGYAAGIVLLMSSLWQVSRKPSEQAEKFRQRVK
jgi:hypothetical protein